MKKQTNLSLLRRGIIPRELDRYRTTLPAPPQVPWYPVIAWTDFATGFQALEEAFRQVGAVIEEAAFALGGRHD